MVPEGSTLRCPLCDRAYPVRKSFVSFFTPDLSSLQDPSEWQWKQSEISARNEQAAFYDRLLGLIVLTPFERSATRRALLADRQRVSVLAEIGCGTGRMLASLAHSAERVIGVDISDQSLEKCHRRLRNWRVCDFLLIQADACFLPIRPNVVDAVASCQMIEHLPSDRMRKRAVREMCRILRPEGRFALSGYHWSLLTRWLGPKEGVHKGGIYYFRFTRSEFLDLIPPQIKRDRLTSLAGYAWLVGGRKETTDPRSS